MGYKLAISDYTAYESLINVWGKRAEEIIAALKLYEWKSVTIQVLRLASILHGLYHDEKIENIRDGDKIIGATAILEAGLVFTRNHKDFPSPFFIPKKFMILPIQHNRYLEHMDLALYEPNIDLSLEGSTKKTTLINSN